jgi:two-component system nitrogen regulation response regulator GlnG
MPRILIIDDEESICWGLAKLCEQMEWESDTASSVEEGLAIAAARRPETIVMDVRLPGMDGLSAISIFRERFGNIPVIIMTAFGDLQTAITAVQNGAYEYIVKPFDLKNVKQTIQQSLSMRQMVSSVSTCSAPESQAGIIGSSRVIHEIFKQIAMATTSDSPILISGESGTGKELTARAIHRFGRRATGPFIAVNIASLNPQLAESELFGHRKGAFTGADIERVGMIQQAHGGTLFLDEVAEIPAEIQVKLLRVLDQGEVTPVGSSTPIKTDFRLVSATHQDLMSQVNHGEFRHDLFFRLRTLEIHLPPLRERKDDIAQLVSHFLQELQLDHPLSASEEFIELLQAQQWNGNIRELKSAVERAVMLARGGILTAAHYEPSATRLGNELPSGIPPVAQIEASLKTLAAQWTKLNWSDESTGPLYEQFIKIIESPIFEAAYEESNHQYSAAARRLGIHRTTLKKKLDSRLD